MAGPMAIEIVAVAVWAVGSDWSVSWTVNDVVPAAVGMPVIAPVVPFSFSPPGQAIPM